MPGNERRIAVMLVDLDLLREMLHLPGSVRVTYAHVTVLPGPLRVLLESEAFAPVPTGVAPPEVQAVYRHFDSEDEKDRVKFVGLQDASGGRVPLANEGDEDGRRQGTEQRRASQDEAGALAGGARIAASQDEGGGVGQGT